MTRFAIPKPEPLRVQHENFRDAVLGRDDRRRHHARGHGDRARRRGLPAVGPRVPHHRRLGDDHAREDRSHRARQDRPAARRAVRRPRARGASASTSTPTRSRPSTTASRRSPARTTSTSYLARLVPAGQPAGHHRLRRGGPDRRRRRGRRAALRRRRRPARLRLDGQRQPRHRQAPDPGHPGHLRDDAAGRHHPDPVEAAARGRERPARGQRLPPGLLARAGADRPGLRRPAQVPQARRRPERRRRGARRATFYEQVLNFDERPDLARGNGVWDLGSAEAAEMAKLAETTYRDVNIGLANQFARLRREGRHRRAPGDRGLQLPALQPHPPARHRRRRPLHPGLPAPLPVRRPGRDRRHAPPARPTPRCRRTSSAGSPSDSAT